MSHQKHAQFPPSRMERILSCAGSFALEATCPPRETKYTDEGHAAHQLAQWALTDGRFDAGAYLGRIIKLHANKGTPQETSVEFKVDTEMCRHVQAYVDSVHDRIEKYKSLASVKSVALHVEKRLDTSQVLGVPKQSGVADVIIVVAYKDGSALVSVEDLKYGAGVKVVAEDNVQLMTYGAAALDAYGRTLDVRKVNLVIHQPRLGFVSTHAVTAKKLRAFAKKLKNGVAAALQQEKVFKLQGIDAVALTPGEKQCRFCRAKSICPAFNAKAGKPPAKAPPKRKPPKNRP